jgi:hypothetical protein
MGTYEPVYGAHRAQNLYLLTSHNQATIFRFLKALFAKNIKTILLFSINTHITYARYVN